MIENNPSPAPYPARRRRAFVAATVLPFTLALSTPAFSETRPGIDPPLLAALNTDDESDVDSVSAAVTSLVRDPSRLPRSLHVTDHSVTSPDGTPCTATFIGREVGIRKVEIEPWRAGSSATVKDGELEPGELVHLDADSGTTGLGDTILQMAGAALAEQDVRGAAERIARVTKLACQQYRADLIPVIARNLLGSRPPDRLPIERVSAPRERKDRQ